MKLRIGSARSDKRRASPEISFSPEEREALRAIRRGIQGMLAPFRRDNYEYIQARWEVGRSLLPIFDRHSGSGPKLPLEEALSKELRYGRTTIREAVAVARAFAESPPKQYWRTLVALAAIESTEERRCALALLSEEFADLGETAKLRSDLDAKRERREQTQMWAEQLAMTNEMSDELRPQQRIDHAIHVLDSFDEHAIRKLISPRELIAAVCSAAERLQERLPEPDAKPGGTGSDNRGEPE